MDKDFEIRNSKIAGSGVFTNKEIKKGQTMYLLQGEVCSLGEILKRVKEGREKLSDPLGIGEEEYLDLDEISRTFNHSCHPNSFILGKSELVAIKDIKRGREITYDYSTTMDDNEEKIKKAGLKLWTCKCNCGSKNCRGVIDQFKKLSKELQGYYIKNRFVPDFMLNF